MAWVSLVPRRGGTPCIIIRRRHIPWVGFHLWRICKASRLQTVLATGDDRVTRVAYDMSGMHHGCKRGVFYRKLWLIATSLNGRLLEYPILSDFWETIEHEWRVCIRHSSPLMERLATRLGYISVSRPYVLVHAFYGTNWLHYTQF